ncbi:MAG TPA: hypothetical protein PLD25_02400 [Chloroflexota bacterium]|nr:hypothetical protein [Chloroflexota bacterium]HUM70696.1 hypothetical protein [Chloroflexota bacterium]
MKKQIVRHAVSHLLLVGFFVFIWFSWVYALPKSQSNDATIYLPLVFKSEPPPQILSFTANVEIADPGDTIELSWVTANAVSVTLYHLLPTGQLGQFWNVAISGTMPYTISEAARNVERFVLYAAREGQPAAGASVEIILTCPYPWFFAPAPDICAQDAALLSPAAEQQFENGWMIWVGEEDLIYVLYDDDVFSPKWQAFTDDWEPGDPVSDTTIIPPEGYYQPLRGFGLVWREQPFVRDRLGWAVALEAGYDTAVQRTSYSRYNHTYIRALDADIWHLFPEHSAWEKFTPQ